MKQYLLIDGNAIMHRAFHALPPLNNAKGQVANAVYGFCSMLLNILSEARPEYITVCFDRPAPTFRKEMYEAYQKHRPKMPDDLASQMPIIHDVLSAIKIPIFEMDGFEADDIIGTLSVQAMQDPQIEVIIVSGDRDLLQLVNGRVCMLAPLTGITKTILYDGEKVREKFGVTPKQMIDYKALVGDPSDGYNGVPGIGSKTASRLLQKYETVEGVYTHLLEINPKVSEKLLAGEKDAELAKKLATIVLDVPVQFVKQKSAISSLDWTGARRVFAEQGFKSLLKRLPEQSMIKDKPSDQLELL